MLSKALRLTAILSLVLAVGCSGSDDDDDDSPLDSGPSVDIQVPEEGAVLPGYEDVHLEAQVADPEDRLETYRARISSNVDGPIAELEIEPHGFISVDIQNLTEGDQEITLTLVDPFGTETSDTVSFQLPPCLGCVHLDPYNNYAWNDTPCTENMYFVCEADGEGLE